MIVTLIIATDNFISIEKNKLEEPGAYEKRSDSSNHSLVNDFWFRCNFAFAFRLNFTKHFLVGYVEEGPWWPIQSPNKGIKKKIKS